MQSCSDVVTVWFMYDRDTLRVHPHRTPDRFGWFATVTTITDGKVTRIYETPTHLDEKSLNGWVKDFNRTLKDARCIWCNDPLRYVTEIDDLNIFGFCSDDCHGEAMREADEIARYE